MAKVNSKNTKNANTKVVKRNKLKETFGELKKVSWPSFGSALKQTGTVLSVVVIFGVLVFGIDLLISYIITLLSSI